MNSSKLPTKNNAWKYEYVEELIEIIVRQQGQKISISSYMYF